jgi:hypothetical protein
VSKFASTYSLLELEALKKMVWFLQFLTKVDQSDFRK